MGSGLFSAPTLKSGSLNVPCLSFVPNTKTGSLERTNPLSKSRRGQYTADAPAAAALAMSAWAAAILRLALPASDSLSAASRLRGLPPSAVLGHEKASVAHRDRSERQCQEPGRPAARLPSARAGAHVLAVHG